MQLLTHSRQDCFKTCRKKHWFSYELGIRAEVDAKALRMGTAYHEGLDLLAQGMPEQDAVQAVWKHYAHCPEHIDQKDWDYESQTVACLLMGYDWYWGSELEILESERSFRLPLVNPDTGKASRNWKLAGKIDGIPRLEDGRLAVKENKLLGESIDTDAPLWKRLNVDHQISLYVIAGRDLGFDVQSVLYDVTRKPTIKPAALPVLDELGAKIVLDRGGSRVKTDRGLYRQTSNKERGYELQTREMTAEEWGERLTEDIAKRPEFYFARREIARLDDDLLQYRRELWAIQQTIRSAQINNQHFRTCNKDTCSWCTYFGPCTSGFDPSGPLPEGFVRLEDIHPELGDFNAHTSTPETEATAG